MQLLSDMAMYLFIAVSAVYLIASVIYLLMSLIAVIYIARFNLHMFQQNGYKNNEQISWLKKNWKKESVLFVWLLIYALSKIGFVGVIFFGFSFALCGFIVYYFRFLKRYHTKKPLVYTPRVKRLIITDSMLSLLIFAVLVYLSRYGFLIDPILAMVIVAVLQQVLFIFANVINHPLEVAINRYYTNDAVRRLDSMRDKMTVIGITGSYGKTSMKHYLEELLSVRYSVLITPGNFNTPLGVVRTIREHLNPSHEIFLCEMGARYVGDIRELCELAKPDMGIITSVGPQHLETFGGMENIVSTKFELASYIEKTDSKDNARKLFLNGDSSYMIEENASHPNAILYSSTNPNEGYHALDIECTRHGTSFTAVTPDGECERFETRLLGEHNVINLIGAIAVAHEFGIPLKELKVPIRRLLPVEHRLELKESANATIIDDAYNSNPIGSKAAVEVLGAMDGTRILVTPGMVELGDAEYEYNYKFGTYAAANCDYVALIGARRIEPVRKGLVDSGFDENRIAVFSRIEEALDYAYCIHTDKHRIILMENDLPDSY